VFVRKIRYRWILNAAADVESKKIAIPDVCERRAASPDVTIILRSLIVAVEALGPTQAIFLQVG
jgi:hypothetical protein